MTGQEYRSGYLIFLNGYDFPWHFLIFSFHTVWQVFCLPLLRSCTSLYSTEEKRWRVSSKRKKKLEIQLEGNFLPFSLNLFCIQSYSTLCQFAQFQVFIVGMTVSKASTSSSTFLFLAGVNLETTCRSA